jgi:hypothetical protein
VLTGWAWVLLCECRVSGCAAVCGPGRLAASKLLLHTLLPCLSHCLWPKNLNAPPPPPPPYAGWHLQAMTLKQTRLHMHPSLSLTHRDTLTHTQSLQPTTHCQHNRGRLSYTLFLVVLQRTYSTVAPPPPPPRTPPPPPPCVCRLPFAGHDPATSTGCPGGWTASSSSSSGPRWCEQQQGRGSCSRCQCHCHPGTCRHGGQPEPHV